MKHCFYGIKKQFFLYTAAIIFSLLIIIAIIFAKTASMSIKKLSLESYSTSNEQHLVNFQSNFLSLSSLTQSYVLNTYIQKALSSSPLSYTDRKYIVSSLRYPNNDLAAFSLYLNNNSEVFYSSEQGERLADKDDILKVFADAVEDTFSRPVLFNLSEDYGEDSGLYILRKIHHLEVNRPHGLLIIKLSENFFQTIFSDNGFEKQSMDLLLDSSFSLCSTKNTTNFSTPNAVLLKQFCTGFQPPYGYEHSCYFFSRQDPETGYWLLSVIPGSIVSSYSAAFYKSMFLISVLALLVLAPLIYLVARHFTNPVLKLSETMAAFSVENMGQELHIHTNTELDTISEGYNKLVGNIQVLLKTLEKNQETLRANEYSLLLHQINPHFLYNTLDNIHMLARLNGDSTTVQLISSLTGLLRISLSNGHEIIPLSQELKHIRCYMDIEKIRTSQLFHYEIDVPPELHDIMIPKLILQPIVENCIKYGFSEIDEGGYISIQISLWEQQLWILIYNNGVPVTKDALRYLNALSALPLEEISRDSSASFGGYGIANVVCRLKLRYQDQFVLCYDSLEGTLCTLVLPAVFPHKPKGLSQND